MTGSTQKASRVHLVVIALVWAVWLAISWWDSRWGLVAENWFMSLTMVFGSFIAGATSEGGGAVAFPVMTLGFKIPPATARDFSFMIQSVGMTAASLVIIRSKIPVVWPAILWSGLGGALGVIVGLEWLAPRLSPSHTKMFFVCFWLGFAMALYWINRDRDRHVALQLPRLSMGDHGLLFAIGTAGGLVSSLTGSGLDILTFSMLVLLFNIDEKVATPTSVVLMASNSLAGFFWREVGMEGMATITWNYWWACIPVVVIGAPLGARFIAGKSRQFVAGFLYLSIAVQFIWALIVIPQTAALVAFALLVICLSVGLFALLWRTGKQHRHQARLTAGETPDA